MINLLPLQQKKSLYKLLVLREVEVFLVGFLCIEIVCIVLLTPGYLFLKTKSSSIAIEVSNLKNSESLIVDKNMNQTINDINTKLSIFPSTFYEVYPSKDVIIPLTKHRVPGIAITGISYTNNTDNTNSNRKPDLEVRGVAKSRLALLDFQKSLESDPVYSVVNVPISDFVKGSNITFSILISTKL